MPLSPGQTLNNRYRVVKLLGQGGFGAVYRAWDTNLNEPVALKESFETSPAAQKQFQLEAKLLFKLHHTNLPRVHDFFVIPEQGMYLVMDYIEGQDLESLSEAAGQPLPAVQIATWASQICDALSYLHAQHPPVIHRDIKPANIRITPDGQAMLVDFGIAKVFDESLQTTTGARALTPGFAPLEQYGQGKTDARTDIYALGATLYALLTRQRPVESVQRTIKDTLPPPEQINPKLPAYLSSAIQRAMQVDPEQRFQSAAEFKRSLQEAEGQGLVARTVIAPTAAASADRAAKPRPTVRQTASPGMLRWGIVGGVGFLALILIGVVFLVFLWMLLSGQITKTGAESTPTHTVAASVTLPGAATPDTQPTDRPAATATIDAAPTSTLFAQAELPDDIPIMPGAADLQVFEVTQGANMLTVSFTVQASDAEIVAYYEREMPNYGWEKTGTFSDDKSLIVYFQKGERVAMVMISHSGGKTMVSISIVQQ